MVSPSILSPSGVQITRCPVLFNGKNSRDWDVSDGTCMVLVYGGEEELVVTGYTNASFQTDKDGSKSQSGYVLKLNGGAISWKSSK